jgi:hypothetical protein
MSNSRRAFLQSSAALAAAGMMGVTATGLAAKPQASPQAQAMPPAAPDTGSHVQIPKIKFGNVEISRMVMGVNPMYGFAQYNNNLGLAMREWYTQERVCEVLHHANKFGINAFNFVIVPRSQEDLACFQKAGGKMHLIVQMMAQDDPAQVARDLKPLALQRRGEEIDAAFRNGAMAAEREWCKRARDTGALIGVGTHKPEVIDLVESQGWDIDFYSGCIYNRTRSPQEWKSALNGEIMEMTGDIYMQSDPARMYKAMRQTTKKCFAFKILAAGRIEGKDVEPAFRTAFASIKPTDGIYVGMFPKFKDEVRENAELVCKILSQA